MKRIILYVLVGCFIVTGCGKLGEKKITLPVKGNFVFGTAIGIEEGKYFLVNGIFEMFQEKGWGEQIFSSDGTKIVTMETTEVDVAPKGIVIYNVQGKKIGFIKTTPYTPSAFFDWSRDGKDLVYLAQKRKLEVFERTGETSLNFYNRAIMIYNFDTKKHEKIFDIPKEFEKVWVNAFRISPDGNRLIFNWSKTGNSESGIYLINRDGTGLKILTSVANEGGWTPDGKHIIYKANHNPDGKSLIDPNYFNGFYIKQNVDTMEREIICKAPNMFIWDHKITRDGKFAFGTFEFGKKRDICVIPLEGERQGEMIRVTKPGTLTDKPESIWSPDWWYETDSDPLAKD